MKSPATFHCAHNSLSPAALKRYLHKEATHEQIDATRRMITQVPEGMLDLPTINFALAVMHERIRSYGYPEYIGNSISYLAETTLFNSVPPMVDPSLPEECFRKEALLRLTLMRYSLCIERNGEFAPSERLAEAQQKMHALRRRKAAG